MMKVLFVVGTCLSKNTSANLSHNSYIRGLVENGCDVDVLSKMDSWGQIDKTLKKLEDVRYIEFESNSLIDKIRQKFTQGGGTVNVTSTRVNLEAKSSKPSFRQVLRSYIKKIYYKIFAVDSIYSIDKYWIKKASKFRSKEKYDLIISNSSPSASHKVAQILIESGRIAADKWVQIWEDPWFHDLYGKHDSAIKAEEKALLDAASEVYYVSPITTEYQKKYFPTAAAKMKTILLPYFKTDEGNDSYDNDTITYGYFGDYYSYTRNLLPLFNVLNKTKRKGYIYGDSDMAFTSETVEVSPRVTLDILKRVQQKTSVLVHLSNIKGGQIPGKIYHYSATTKPILFILDGTTEEQALLHEYFAKYNRYFFCENSEQSILHALESIEAQYGDRQESVVEEYSPKQVIKTILDNKL